MFDIGALELLVLVVVAIIVIGPKDMPAAMRVVGRWVGKLRRASAQFQAGFDNIVREAEMEDMEKKWKEQNAKIMAETPEGEMGPLSSAAEAAVDQESKPTDLAESVAKEASAEVPKTATEPVKKTVKKTGVKPKPAKSRKGKPQVTEPMLPLDESGGK